MGEGAGGVGVAVTIKPKTAVSYKGLKPSNSTMKRNLIRTIAAFGIGATLLACGGAQLGSLFPPTIASITPSTAHVGDDVEVLGAFLTSGSTALPITFNGVAATQVTVVDDNHLTVRVPAGATTGPVIVTNGNLGDSNSFQFTVN